MTLSFNVSTAVSLLLATLLPCFAQDLAVKNAFPRLSFTQPVFLTHSNDASNRIFVVEQAGTIKVFANDSSVTTAETFLDIHDRVLSGGEMGLLGLAFHPDFASRGFFYVDYTRATPSRRTIISRFEVSATDSNRADENSELILLEIPQFASNHNGGMLQFGPDGFLYIGMGDGGGGGDPQGNGQDRTTLLGSLLRIDVDNPAEGLNYGIPATNPFVGEGGGVREEIFAYGLRNLWRFSIDEQTGQIWAGDVGQNRLEEVDLIRIGRNYGWNKMEGFDCFPAGSPPLSCDSSGLTLPVIDYPHFPECSVTGGYIYRGAIRPDLQGAYIYGDFCSGKIWQLRYENGQVQVNNLLLDTPFAISSFGIDAQNELHIVDRNGAIYRFKESIITHVQSETALRPIDHFLLRQNYPNPFNPETTIVYKLTRTDRVQLSIYNLLGQEVRSLVDAAEQAGEFRVIWDGRNDVGQSVSSGVYVARLQVGEATQFTKMVLMR